MPSLYARADLPVAENPVETLSPEGFEGWLDNRIYAGARWESLPLGTLAEAKAILVLRSRRSVERPWVIDEAILARETHRLVPARIDDCALPPGFEQVQAAILPGWSGRGHRPGLERLLTGLARLAPPSRIENVRPGLDTGVLGLEIRLHSVAGVAEELRCRHVRMVLNPARRLAWYAAYKLGPAAFQPQDDRLRGSGPDRGHLAAPRTVSWGTPARPSLPTARRSSGPTGCPQHPNLNRGWRLAVEQWEREQVPIYGRALGFAGPVHCGHDPIHRDIEQSFGRLRVRLSVHLPQPFWKLVPIRDREGRLASAACMLDRGALLRERGPLGAEPARFRCRVADIGSLTGLDFGAHVRGAAPLPRWPERTSRARWTVPPRAWGPRQDRICGAANRRVQRSPAQGGPGRRLRLESQPPAWSAGRAGWSGGSAIRPRSSSRWRDPCGGRARPRAPGRAWGQAPSSRRETCAQSRARPGRRRWRPPWRT